MAEQSLKDKTVKGVIWSSVERMAGQLVQFFVMIVLARLLTPHDYGLIGMIAIFIALSQSLIDSGFSQALIRKKECTEEDYSTVFYFNIVVSTFVFILFYFVAPLVQSFYEEPELAVVMRLLCVSIIINAFSIVPKAIFTIRLNFKIQSISSIVAALVSGLIGIGMALNGGGVWSLVAQQLAYAFFSTLILWIYSKWSPKLVFSKESFVEMFSFGSKLMAVGVINTIFTNLYTIVIGKIYASTTLGFYTRGQHFAELPAINITSIVQRVSYPVMCKMQDDKIQFTSFFVRVLKMTAYCFFPLMAIIAGVSIPVVEIVLGSKWTYCGVLMIPLCFAMMWYPFHALNLNILEVVGKSDLFLKLEIVKKTITVIVLVTSIPLGVEALCYSQVFTSILFIFINAWYTKSYLYLSFIEQLKLYLPSFLTSLLIFAFIFVIGKALGNVYLWFIEGIVLGPGLYYLLSRFIGFSQIGELKILLAGTALNRRS